MDPDLPTYEKNAGSYQSIEIDATAGKFSPRSNDGDTQVNAGTVLTIPVGANEAGATLEVALSGGSANYEVSGAVSNVSSDNKTIGVQAAGGNVVLKFTSNTYLKSMSLTYNEPEAQYPGTPEDVSAQDTEWDLAALDITACTFEGKRGEVDGLLVNAEDGKFAPREGDVQVKAGTTIYVPVAESDNGATLLVEGSANGQVVAVDGAEVSLDQPVTVDTSSTHYVAISVTGSGSAYFNAISLTYGKPEADFPGPIGMVAADDKSWDLSSLDQETQRFQDTETPTGEVDGLQIDARADGAKFAPRDGDTQVNGGTTIYIPVAQSDNGATLLIEGNANGQTVKVDGEEITPGVPVSIDTTDEAHYVTLSVEGDNSAYLTGISLSYAANAPEFPGTPEGVEATDKTWDLTGGIDGEGDALQGSNAKSVLDNGLAIDATASGAKWDPRPGDTQVNHDTTIYVPVAQSEGNTTITVSGTFNGQTVTVDGAEVISGVSTVVDSSSTRFVPVVVSGGGSAYLTSIAIDYDAVVVEYPGTPENVSAEDTTWNLMNVTPEETFQGTRGEHEGILVDATASDAKFQTRDGDTQVNTGTVLYVPVAADADVATLRIEASNTAGTELLVNGKSAQYGRDIEIAASDEDRYVKVEIVLPDGATEAKSAYLTSISVDYASDNQELYHVVTVGAEGKYRTISDALANEESSQKNHLVLSIAPGDYHERVVVTQPGVIFQNADSTGENAVVIHESYFSGNVWDADGNYVKQDPVRDLGTDQCATVLVDSSATGFSAYGITFQNDYNVVDHTEEGSQTPAVAFNSKADKINLQNCRFIGRQDTLYLQGAGNRVYMDNCYIEGTVDFVFGDADAYVNNSVLYMAEFPGRTVGYYTAANTKAGYTGLVFVDCTLGADPSVTDVSLGRPWQNLAYYTGTHVDDEGHTVYDGFDPNKPHPDYANVSSAVTFVGCTMPTTLKAEHWNQWAGRTKDEGNTHPISYDATVRFTEVGCTYLSGSVDKGELVLGKVNDLADGQTVEDYADELSSNMLIGGTWKPEETERADDEDAWGLEPEPDTPPTEGPSTGEGENPPTGEGGQPGTEDPGTETPNPNEPSTDAPTEDEPTTDPGTNPGEGQEGPGAEQPGDEPSTDQPSEDQPATDEPSTDAPSTDQPSEGEPSVDNPTEDQPGSGIGQPSEDEPSVDEPGTDKPSDTPEDQPGTDTPSEDNPSTDAPSTDQPSEDEPNVDSPSEEQPSEDKPGAGAEDTPSDEQTGSDDGTGTGNENDGTVSADGEADQGSDQENAGNQQEAAAKEDAETGNGPSSQAGSLPITADVAAIIGAVAATGAGVSALGVAIRRRK